jgi:hypothetical protein
MENIKTVGSKAEVFHGTAKHTSGGLKKKDLMRHKGRIVSRKKHAAGKKAIQRLFKAGYKPKKGTFKLMGSSGRRSTRRRGGNYAASAADATDMSGNTPPSSTLGNILDVAATGSPAASGVTGFTGFSK